MTENENHRDIIIIGGGPAGLTAGIYSARGGAKTTIFSGILPGGQLIQTMEVENFPGFFESTPGADIMQKMIQQAKRLGCEISNNEITEVDFNVKPFKITVSSKKIFTTDSVIISTGAKAKWMGIPSETKFRNKGVSSCATCDGFFHRNKDVCVIGGGDTAAEDALFLTKFSNKVYLVHRRDKLRTNRRSEERLKANPKIEILYDSVLDEVLGEEKVSGIKIKNVKTNDIREINLSGVFIAIGHHPETSLFKDKIEIDEQGYIKTDGHTKTSVEGVFAAGDVMDPNYKQAIIAAGTGAIAGMQALKYIEDLECDEFIKQKSCKTEN
ncbi:MAG: thioredoxin-disulfide reductase [Elusimicrobiales bacterium]|nr:thioredoxin-disulfide reductase [Elusimicrobiales bacterium]